jgi:hypothetical protein
VPNSPFKAGAIGAVAGGCPFGYAADLGTLNVHHLMDVLLILLSASVPSSSGVSRV